MAGTPSWSSVTTFIEFAAVILLLRARTWNLVPLPSEPAENDSTVHAQKSHRVGNLPSPLPDDSMLMLTSPEKAERGTPVRKYVMSWFRLQGVRLAFPASEGDLQRAGMESPKVWNRGACGQLRTLPRRLIVPETLRLSGRASPIWWWLPSFSLAFVICS